MVANFLKNFLQHTLAEAMNAYRSSIKVRSMIIWKNVRPAVPPFGKSGLHSKPSKPVRKPEIEISISFFIPKFFV